MGTSKLQKRTSSTLSYHFGKYTIRENSRPYWCIGLDGERLELDFYILELDVAIEVQGEQHYRYVPMFHGTYDGFRKQKERDDIKAKRCENYKVKLLEVYDELSLNDAVSAIKEIEVQSSKPKPHTDRFLHYKAEDWVNWYTLTNQELITLWNRRHATKTVKFHGKVNHKIQVVQSIIAEYGVQTMEPVPEDVTQSLFWHMNKLKIHCKLLKSGRKKRVE